MTGGALFLSRERLQEDAAPIHDGLPYNQRFSIRDEAMSDMKIRTRPVGAQASLNRTGMPSVTSATGGSLEVVTSVSQAGFSPLDLLYASLSSCLVLSARAAASRLGVLEQLEAVRAHVTGDKAADGPSRIARFNIVIEIDGAIDDATRHAIVEAAENEICTISNTLHAVPEFSTTLRDA